MCVPFAPVTLCKDVDAGRGLSSRAKRRLRDTFLFGHAIRVIRRRSILWIAERLVNDKHKAAREAFANPRAKVDNLNDKIDVGVKQRI